MKFKAFMKLLVAIIINTLILSLKLVQFALEWSIKGLSWVMKVLDKVRIKMKPAQQIRTILGTKD